MTHGAPAQLTSYINKLERRKPLPEAERAALLSLPTKLSVFEGRKTALNESSFATAAVFVVNGLVSRQIERGGSRRIVAFCLPGDSADLHALFFEKTDHSLVTHGPTTLAYVNHADILEVIEKYPLLTKVLWHDTLVEAAIFREWTTNVGHGSALARVAHLILEFEARTNNPNANRNTFKLPLTQAEIANALGLSLVHLNRSLQNLKRDKMIAVKNGNIVVLDQEHMKELSHFNPAYLHLETAPMLEKTKGIV